MLEPINFIPFLIAASVLAITPGPSILYVMARTVAGGRTDGVASTLGTAAGGLVHVMISAIGLAAVLAASAEAFTLIKLLGAAYLIYLGFRTIREANVSMMQPRLKASGSRRAFWEGVLTETFNVKVALFFFAFIPQFINHTAATTPQFLLLGLICVGLNMLADLFVVFGTSRLLPLFNQHSRAESVFHYGSGGMLVGLGTYVALAQVRR